MASSTPPSSKEEALAERERLVRNQTEQNIVPGIQHAIIDDQQQVDFACSGVADKSQAFSSVVDSSTLFMAYSCTKVVTAIAILQLVDQGKLKLEDSLTQHYPEHPYNTDKVTIQALLTHKSGVPNPMPLDWFVTEEESLDSDKILQTILAKNNQLKFEPGSKRLYSNLGYWLLEKCIEGASQLSYADYIQTHILDPLHIPKEQATFDLLAVTSTNNDKLATGHLRKWTVTNALFYLISPQRYWIQPSKDGWSRFARLRHFGQAYGGLYCTVACFASILKDLLVVSDSSSSCCTLLSEERRQLFLDDPALGGFVTGELKGVTYYGKQGGGFGFHGNIRLYPSIGIATAFMANSTEVSEGPIDARANILDAPIVEFQKSKTTTKE